MRKHLFFIITLLSILFSQANAQSNDLVEIQNSIESYTGTHLPEKLYMHTDKWVYLNNEICWFKIYTLDGFFHTPLNLNKVAYIELLDANHQAVMQEKISLQNATGSGALQLPANIPSGKYTLVAYTNWMKNYNPAFFFSKNITILNTQNGYDGTNPKQKASYLLNLYPESGTILNGLSNRIAFSATDTYGKGIQVKGWVLNNKLDTLVSFTTLMNGLGSFSFTPKDQESYKAVIETPAGMIEKALPASSMNGYGIQIQNNNSNDFKLTVNHVNNNNKSVYLIIHCRGIIKKAIQITLGNEPLPLNISQNDLGDGINTCTLFDSNKKPVAERLLFKYPNQGVGELQLETNSFKNRSKVNLSITSNAIHTYDASIAVYKIDSLQGIDEMNIQNYVWLSSDLVGKVEAPQSYFDINNPNRFVAMNHLMLTHGWRRFTQENLTENNSKPFNYLPEIGGMLITGKIVNKGTTIPSKETAGYLSVPSKNTVFKSALSDVNGKVTFQFQEFNNEGQIIAQADSIKNIKNKIEIDNPFMGKSVKWNTPAPLDINKLPKQAITAAHRNIQVQSYFSPQYATQFSASLQDTNAFYYTPDRTYFLDDYARFATLEEVIREYVTPVTLVKEKGKYQFYVYDDAYKQFFEQSPLVLLDGVIIKDIDQFLEYDPLKIRKLEVVSKVYYAGNLAYNGIINFTTYTGKLDAFEMDPNAVILDYKGLQSKRIFNAPVYETEAQVENRLPDFRQLLYWKPDALIGKKNNFSFYTSDMNGNFMISVQGINKDGSIFNQSIPFSVK
jgi:hypothetical protein